MSTDNEWSRPVTLLCLALVFAVAGIALYFVLPVFGVALGLAIKTATTGLETAGVGTWVAAAASVGVAALGVTAATAGLKKAQESMQKEPYAWGVPVLGVFAAFVSNMAKDVANMDKASGWLFVAATALLIVVASACDKRSRKGWTAVAVALYLIPPFTLLISACFTPKRATLVEAFRAVDTRVWIAFGSLIAISGLIALLVRADEKRDEGTLAKSAMA